VSPLAEGQDHAAPGRASGEEELAGIKTLCPVLRILLAKALQCALTQKVGIALALVREFQNCLGNDFVNLVETVSNSKRYAGHFERDTHDTRRLAIECNTVEEWGYRHDLRSPNLTREREQHRSLSGVAIIKMTKERLRRLFEMAQCVKIAHHGIFICGFSCRTASNNEEWTSRSPL
jgi:hypothetical protein